jgi:Predicted xylanase/chitin deacetylase
VEKSQLIISLDFELHWGRFDKYSLDANRAYYTNTREIVPRVLDLFSKYKIQATWATVGMLMCENREEWEFYKPSLLPSFEESKFSAYSWMTRQEDVWETGLFAPDLVKEIIQRPGQELGSHSYAHYYSLEEGQTLAQWSEDLKAAKRIALEKFGVDLESLVFPRNQYSEAVINVAGEAGFHIFRTNPGDWFWKDVEKENLIKKIFRTGDTLFSLGLKTSYTFPGKNDPKFLPASRILRPYRAGSIFNQRRISRIKEEINTAIKYKEIYHLWWHPHNFGQYPEENLRVLEDLLSWIKRKKGEGEIESESMQSFFQKRKVFEKA